jgi:hypothetical protein
MLDIDAGRGGIKGFDIANRRPRAAIATFNIGIDARSARLAIGTFDIGIDVSVARRL